MQHVQHAQHSADVVVCGAGIAGVAAAYHLASRRHIRNVVLVDEREPMTLTSDKGTQGYRNWWPGPDDTMFRLVSRSIDLLEESAMESGNSFRMSRHGYLFATARAEHVARLESTARRISEFGMGELRRHPGSARYTAPLAEGFADQPTGADLLTGDEVHRAFPYLAPDTVAALHVRRAGWLNAVSLAGWMLKRAMADGARFVRGKVSAVDTTGGRVRRVTLDTGATIDTDRFVIAAGPGLPEVGRLLGVDLPVFHELHAKLTFRDTRRAVPREAPFLIWDDPVPIAGREPAAGVHIRPVDLAYGDELYLIWTYETDTRPYVWPPSFDASYADTVLRGCARMIPGMEPYVEDRARSSRSAAVNSAHPARAERIDGGYYCKTRENRPLIGPLPIQGAYVLGALSGSGVMAAHASAELLSLHVAGETLPDYARWFLPSRYDDPAYRALIEQWGPLVGQL